MGKLLKDTCSLAAEILDGAHDGDLDYIVQAVAARQKARFRKGARVRLAGTRNPAYEGREGVILRVNQKTVAVGLGEKSEWGYETELNVPTQMLEVAAAAAA